MCGIAGIWSRTLTERDLRAGLSKLTHRGPDETSLSELSNLESGKVLIGMTRLAIVDIKSGHQPYSNESGTIGVVFNGEIYNHKELRESLTAKGHSFSSEADGEVIAHLYEEHGTEFPKSLNGMFAIALFDKKNQTLLLTRDRFGEKPLYYSIIAGEVVFASELSALRAISPKTTMELDPQAAANLLTYGFITSPSSIYRDIKKVPAGATVQISTHAQSIDFYWLPAHESEEEARGTNSKIEDVEEVLENAVKIRIPEEVKYGVLLSGGIDSALIARYAARLSPDQIPSFTVSFPGTRFDESSAAKTTSQLLGLSYNEVRFPDNPEALWNEYIETFDEPNLDSSSLPMLLVSREASSFVKVLLSGDGGDELFGGYPKYQQAMAISHIRNLPPVFASILGSGLRSPKGKRLVQILAAAKSGSAALSDSLNEQYFFGSENFVGAPTISRPNWTNRNQASMNRSLWLDLDLLGYLPGVLQKVDTASMAHSIEVRSPMLDIRLYEMSRGVGAKDLFDLFQTKKILREIASTILPDAITKAPKSGFSPHRGKVIDWRLSTGGSAFGQGSSPLEQALGVEFDQGFWSELISCRPEADRKIWAMLVLNDWIQKWL